MSCTNHENVPSFRFESINAIYFNSADHTNFTNASNSYTNTE